MNKVLLIVCLIFSISCSKKEAENNPGQNPGTGSCGTLNGYTLYKNAEGCYYLDSYGYKVYVASNECSC